MTFRAVAVRGGDLSVEVLPGGTAPVLAIHGVSSNCRLWNWLRAEAPEISLVAPDLRGRAHSAGLPGPSSLAQHTEDVVAVLDALGLDRVTVCGMSMGGFVAVRLATSHPERVRALVLVDGGLPMRDDGLTPEAVRTAFSAQASRTRRRFAGTDEYAELSSPGRRCSTSPIRCSPTTWRTTSTTGGSVSIPKPSSRTPSTPCSGPRPGSPSTGRAGSCTRSGASARGPRRPIRRRRSRGSPPGCRRSSTPS